MEWHLAQINVARLRAPLHDPTVAEFVAALDDLNALAERSPGFVWRPQGDDGNATSIRAHDDERVIVNLSTWTSVETLADYVFRSFHAAFLRRKRDWFERFGSAHVALWWVPEGTRPAISDAVGRLQHLEAHGPSPTAFTFAKRFDAQEAYSEQEREDACPA